MSTGPQWSKAPLGEASRGWHWGWVVSALVIGCAVGWFAKGNGITQERSHENMVLIDLYEPIDIYPPKDHPPMPMQSYRPFHVESGMQGRKIKDRERPTDLRRIYTLTANDGQVHIAMELLP